MVLKQFSSIMVLKGLANRKVKTCVCNLKDPDYIEFNIIDSSIFHYIWKSWVLYSSETINWKRWARKKAYVPISLFHIAYEQDLLPLKKKMNTAVLGQLLTGLLATG